MNRYENRKWIFLNSGDMSEVDYGQVLQTSADTCRYSVDGTKSFVKYETTTYPIDINAENVDSEGTTYNFEYEQAGTASTPEGEMPLYSNNIISSGLAFASGEVVGEPDIINKALTISGKKEFSHSETLSILAGSDWTAPMEQN